MAKPAKLTDGRTRHGMNTVKIAPQKKGQTPLAFQAGGLHRALHVPADEPIPKGKLNAAAAGQYGAKAQKQAIFYEKVLKTGQKTAAKNRSKKAKKS
jgi:hypothetical protein